MESPDNLCVHPLQHSLIFRLCPPDIRLYADEPKLPMQEQIIGRRAAWATR